MNITLRTKEVNEAGVFGEFIYDSDKVLCQTLERSYLTDGGMYAPKIPRKMIYKCIRKKSPKFGYDVFMLENVPGHDCIEIHVANFEDQLDGCIAVGESSDNKRLFDSVKSFNKLMNMQNEVSEFFLTVL